LINKKRNFSIGGLFKSRMQDSGMTNAWVENNSHPSTM
jgi:hypothetical protein